jgi:photosystem II stability/assembly factor-like uncharacterized protein
MSSGPGDQSRLYKTTDGCHSWKLSATNPDKDGFWDAIQAQDAKNVVILGDSVRKECRIWNWNGEDLEHGYLEKCEKGEGSFAASNSVLEVVNAPQSDPTWKYSLRVASATAERAYFTVIREEHTPTCEPCRGEINRLGFAVAGATSGIFSFAFRTDVIGVFVGGDYKKPDASEKTAGHSENGGIDWHPAQTAPHGYRSAVAYDASTKTWITVGPNGTDISTDDGRNWRPVHPNPALHEAPDADRNWNALSLPYVVGPHGRIGKLEPTALVPSP